MKSKTEAIIISSMNLGEADKLVTFFSLDRGMLKGVAKNARKSFRRFGAGLESFTYCRLHLYEREHQELAADRVRRHHRTARVHLRRPGPRRGRRGHAGTGSGDWRRSGERNAPAFLLLSHVLHLLDEGEDPLFLLRIFEIRFLSLLGYQPKLDHCLSCGTRSERGDHLSRHEGRHALPGLHGLVRRTADTALPGRGRVLLPGAQDGHGQGLPAQTFGRDHAGTRPGPSRRTPFTSSASGSSRRSS